MNEEMPTAVIETESGRYVVRRDELRRPRRFSSGGLARAGVELIDPNRVSLRCGFCGQLWFPNILTGGKLPRGYWRCPNDCNKHAR